jgi:hypothetical protein
VRPQKFYLIGDKQREAAVAAVSAAKHGTVVTLAPRNRSTEQNALLHKWFSEIATQSGDQSLLDVKAQCNLTYGRPIKAQDHDWQAVFGYLFDKLPYDKKLKAVTALDIPFTRDMTVDQLAQYMEQMERDYRSEGFVLSSPQDLGW